MKNLYLFDCYGVILSPCSVRWFTAHFGKEKAQEMFAYYFKGVDIGDRTFDDALRQLSGDTNIPLEQLKQDWLDLLVVNYEFLDFIKILKKNHKTILLSNAATGQVEWMFNYKNLKLSDYFDKVFISADYHMEKPDIRFYQIALKSYEQDRFDKIFMVDDNPNNLNHLTSIGITPILMTTNNDVIDKLICK